MKFSERFNRDYNFYLDNIGTWNFCGTLNPKFEAIGNELGLSAKECFYLIESEGKNKPCRESLLLNRLLLSKASINFQIKEWAQGRADGTLPLIELSKRYAKLTYPDIEITNEPCTLVWINKKPCYFEDIESFYNLPEWVIMSVENQKVKYFKS